MSPKNTPTSLTDFATQQNTPEHSDMSKFLDGKIITESHGRNLKLSIGNSSISLEMSTKHHKFIEELMRALIVERGVCQARNALLSECKAGVSSKGILPTYSGPDLYFQNTLLSKTPVTPFETMTKVFGDKPRGELEKLVNFVNTIPKEYIVPRSTIEDGPGYPR